MKIRKVVPLIFLGIVALVSWFIYSAGFFKPLEIRQEKMGAMIFLYKEHVGPYHEITDAISAVESWAKDKKIPCRKTFGEYLDNPQIVEHERLRSLGGCIVDSAVTDLPADIKVKTTHEKDYVVGLFHGAPMLGPYKVYPKMSEYMVKNNLKQGPSVIEIYEMITEKELLTKYLFEIVKE